MGTYVSNVQTTRLTATNTVSAGPCRLLAIYFVADTTAGTIELKRWWIKWNFKSSI